MPSIPQSLLWISLVVLWLFVLVPMLISKRDAVRRTSDVALATRVLNSGAAARLLKRGGPAAGHRSDPDWQPDEDEHGDLEDLGDLESDDTEEMPQARGESSRSRPRWRSRRPGPTLKCTTQTTRWSIPTPKRCPRPRSSPSRWPRTRLPDGEDTEDADEVDTVDDSDDEGADQYEYVDDTSGIPVAEEPPATVAPAFSRRHRYDSDTAAAVSARKYAFRKRVLMVMALACWSDRRRPRSC